jgi:glycopeptide antibiotics resistance protein
VLRDLSFDIWPVGIVFLVVPLILLWRSRHSLPHLFCAAVFGIYVVFALQKTFFPLMISGTYPDAMRREPFLNFVNVIPFYPGPWGYSESYFIGNMQNIALTMPFGFGVSFVARLRAKDFLWLAPALGLGIELAQLIAGLLLRYPFRMIDVNDSIMNALGVWIGYGLFRGFAWLYLWISGRLRMRHRWLSAYVVEVAHQVQAGTPSGHEG